MLSNSLSDFARCDAMSMPSSAITSMAHGCTSVGSLPALYASYLSAYIVSTNPSAICERAALCVQRNKIFFFAFIFLEHPPMQIAECNLGNSIHSNSVNYHIARSFFTSRHLWLHRPENAKGVKTAGSRIQAVCWPRKNGRPSALHRPRQARIPRHTVTTEFDDHPLCVPTLNRVVRRV